VSRKALHKFDGLQRTLRLLHAAVIPSVCALFFFTGCARSHSFKAPLEPRAAIGTAAFRQEIGNLLGPPFTGGNRITTYSNGNEIFPAMLRAIRSAKSTITFETFVFEKGDVPEAFANALAERARAGVKVHVIVDAHGARKSREYHAMWRDAGVQLQKYHPLLYWDLRRYNNRTHRKLLVVDGKVGFIGGVGIADQWAGNADSPNHWRDNHYRIDGPAVAQLQAAFAENWLRTAEEVLHGPEYFPPLPNAGSVQGSVFYSSPRHGAIDVPIMYHLAIASARRSLLIENAYFVPDHDTLEALTAAAKRGVHVEILVPGRHIDQKAVRRASRKRWKNLLEAGVQLFEYQPTMIHSKLLIADGLFVSIGSANFDNRSLHLNDEANFNVLDSRFAAEQTRIFERDRAKSVRITLQNYRDRHLTEIPLEAVQTPLEPQL
jgi:cardiolipin synthase